MRHFLKKILLASCLIPVCATVMAGEPAGRVLMLLGTGTVVRGNQQLPMARGTVVESGDLIRMGDASTAQIRFSDEAMVALRPNTEFRIEEYRFSEKGEGDSSVFTLVKGGLRTITGLIGKRNPAAYEMRGSTATIGIRGTHYTVVNCEAACLNADGSTAPKGLYGGVSEGRIVVKNTADSKEFARDQYFSVASADGQITPLLAPPVFLREKLDKLSRTATTKPASEAEKTAEAEPTPKSEAANSETATSTAESKTDSTAIASVNSSQAVTAAVATTTPISQSSTTTDASASSSTPSTAVNAEPASSTASTASTTAPATTTSSAAPSSTITSSTAASTSTTSTSTPSAAASTTSSATPSTKTASSTAASTSTTSISAPSAAASTTSSATPSTTTASNTAPSNAAASVSAPLNLTASTSLASTPALANTATTSASTTSTVSNAIKTSTAFESFYNWIAQLFKQGASQKKLLDVAYVNAGNYATKIDGVNKTSVKAEAASLNLDQSTVAAYPDVVNALKSGDKSLKSYLEDSYSGEVKGIDGDRSYVGTYRKSESTHTDSESSAGNAYWGRFSEKSDLTYSDGTTATQSNIRHWAVGSPVTDMPTSGIYKYSSVGGTSPTDQNGEVGKMISRGSWQLNFGQQKIQTASDIKWSMDDTSYALKVPSQSYQVTTSGAVTSLTAGNGGALSSTTSCSGGGCQSASSNIAVTPFGSKATGLGVGIATTATVSGGKTQQTSSVQVYER